VGAAPPPGVPPLRPVLTQVATAIIQIFLRKKDARGLRSAFKRLGVEGSSTHSFWRTAITWMHNERVPIKHIQSISGHKSLSAYNGILDFIGNKLEIS
jgi:integrase